MNKQTQQTVEPFQTTPTIATSPDTLPDLKTLLPPDPANESAYFQYDPTAAWVQADIASLEYPGIVSAIYNDITNNPNCKSTSTNPNACPYIDGYFFWVKMYSAKWNSDYVF